MHAPANISTIPSPSSHSLPSLGEEPYNSQLLLPLPPNYRPLQLSVPSHSAPHHYIPRSTILRLQQTAQRYLAESTSSRSPIQVQNTTPGTQVVTGQTTTTSKSSGKGRTTGKPSEALSFPRTSPNTTGNEPSRLTTSRNSPYAISLDYTEASVHSICKPSLTSLTPEPFSRPLSELSPWIKDQAARLQENRLDPFALVEETRVALLPLPLQNRSPSPALRANKPKTSRTSSSNSGGPVRTPRSRPQHLFRLYPPPKPRTFTVSASSTLSQRRQLKPSFRRRHYRILKSYNSRHLQSSQWLVPNKRPSMPSPTPSPSSRINSLKHILTQVARALSSAPPPLMNKDAMMPGGFWQHSTCGQEIKRH